MTDAERIAELEEQLRQRDARISELERTVGYPVRHPHGDDVAGLLAG